MNTTSLPTGTLLHSYRIPVKGIQKKVIYHFSDVHLATYDTLSDENEKALAIEKTEDWANNRNSFAEDVGEPHTEAQQKSTVSHFLDFLSIAQDGDALVMTGDICDYVSSANMRFLQKELSGLTYPWLYVLGNHEERALIPEGLVFSGVKEPVQVLETGDFLLVGIDDSTHSVTAAQNAALRAILETGKPIVVAMHIPVMTDSNRSIFESIGQYFRLNHPDATAESLEFVELLKENAGQILAVLAGHVHWATNTELAPGLTQYVATQGLLGNINRYEIGEF